MDENEKLIKSTDLATYLITEGFNFLGTTPPNGRNQIDFLFANDSIKLDEAIRSFENMTAVSNAAQLLFNHRDLIKRVKREREVNG